MQAARCTVCPVLLSLRALIYRSRREWITGSTEIRWRFTPILGRMKKKSRRGDYTTRPWQDNYVSWGWCCTKKIKLTCVFETLGLKTMFCFTCYCATDATLTDIRLLKKSAFILQKRSPRESFLLFYHYEGKYSADDAAVQDSNEHILLLFCVLPFSPRVHINAWVIRVYSPFLQQRVPYLCIKAFSHSPILDTTHVMMSCRQPIFPSFSYTWHSLLCRYTARETGSSANPCYLAFHSV